MNVHLDPCLSCMEGLEPLLKTTVGLSNCTRLLSLEGSESTAEHCGPFSEPQYVNGCYCLIVTPGKKKHTEPTFVDLRPVKVNASGSGGFTMIEDHHEELKGFW